MMRSARTAMLERDGERGLVSRFFFFSIDRPIQEV